MAEITSNQIATLVDGLNLTEEQIAQLTRNLATARNQALLSLDEETAKASQGTRVTKKGFDLIAKAISGKELKFSRVSYGDSVRDGEIVYVTPEEGVLLEDLINWKINLPMSDIKFNGGGTCVIKFIVQNANITHGFWAREIALFAFDPDTGDEVMFCYRNTGDLSDYIPAGGGSVVLNLVVGLTTVVDAATNVTAVIDGNLAFVTQTELGDHVNAADPHPNLPKRGDDVASTNFIWVTDNDFDVHRISLANLQRLILGGDANTMPKMEKRISQLEINLSNMAMQLKSENDFGYKPNLMLVEDFTTQAYCDMYACNVIAQIAGVNGFQIASDKDILKGHWYTITDGIHAEYVRIKSVAKNADNHVIILEGNLVNTFNLENTVLLRSTTLIRNSAAEGAGDLRGLTIPFKDTWQGTGGQVASTLTLDTSQSQAANFDITSDGSFNSNGEFTLTA